MELQNIFYLIGITAMMLWIIIVISGLILVYRVKKATDTFKSSFRGKIVGIFQEKNIEIASALGLTFAHFVIDRFRKNKQKKEKS